MGLVTIRKDGRELSVHEKTYWVCFEPYGWEKYTPRPKKTSKKK